MILAPIMKSPLVIHISKDGRPRQYVSLVDCPMRRSHLLRGLQDRQEAQLLAFILLIVVGNLSHGRTSSILSMTFKINAKCTIMVLSGRLPVDFYTS